MPATVSHQLSATTPDDPSYEIRPSHWNSVHDAVINAVGSEVSGAFANGGGVTFGYDGTNVTAAAPPGAPSPVNFSAGVASANLGSVVFSNSNGVSFGLNGSTITATVATNYQSQGAYLTTAMQSNAETISNIKVSAGLSSSNVSAITFNNSNGVSFGYDGTNITATVATNYQSQGAYLTTARASNDGIGTNTAQSNVTWTVNSAGLSFDARGYAGTGTSATNASVTLNSNGLQISVAAPGGGGGAAISGGANSQNTGTVNFSNSNGVTFGLSNNGVMTASVATNYQSQGAYLTTARASNDAIGLNTALTANGVSMTANSSGLSLNFPAFLTTAMQSNAATISNIKVSAGASSANLSALTFSNSNGVSFGLNGGTITATVATNYQSQGAYLTTARASNDGIGLNTAQSNVTWTANSDGLSFDARGYAGTGTSATNASITLNSNGLQISVAAPGGGGTTNQTGPNIADANGHTITDGTVVFSNSNLVSFGLNGSTMTASYGDPDNWALYGNTAGTSASTIGTGGLYFQGGNNVTLSGSSNTIVISAGAGGGAATMQDWLPYQMALTTNTSIGNGSVYFCPILPPNNISMSVVEIISSNAVGTFTGAFTKGMTLSYGLYSENGATLSLMSSSSIGLTITQNSSTALGLTYSDGAGNFNLATAQSTHSAINILKAISLPFAGSMAAGGLYFWGQNMSTSSAGSNVAVTYSQLFNAEVATSNIGAWGGTNGVGTNKSIIQEPYGFIRSATSGGLPSSCAYTDMSAYSNYQPYLYFEN